PRPAALPQQPRQIPAAPGTAPLRGPDAKLGLRRHDRHVRPRPAPGAAVLPDLPTPHRRRRLHPGTEGISMSSASRPARESRQARNARLAATDAPKVNKLALLSETLLLGVCLFVLALPVVTAPAAYAAGAAHMERHISGRPDTVASLWVDFRAALPGSWKLGLVLLGAGIAAVVNLLLAGSEQLP